MEIISIMFFAALVMASTATGEIIYVDDDATSPGDGTSWETAFTYLQDALMVASSGHEIRVAQGIYRPDDFVLSARPNMGRMETFQLINGVTLKGGYAGFGQPDPNTRDVEAYETILSGDLNGNDGPIFQNNNENSYHVVTGSGTNETTMLDAFIISGGNASGTFQPNQEKNSWIYKYKINIPPPIYHTEGGGMHNDNGSPTIINCVFIGNSASEEGGGIYNKSNSNPTITNCTFSRNSAYFGGGLYGGNAPITNCTFNGNLAEWGGGMANVDQPMLTNCLFIGNSSNRDGGGMYASGSNSALTNCKFSGNSSGWSGGGIYNSDGSMRITSCAFTKNSASQAGGGMHNRNSYSNTSPALTNCTFTGNSALNGNALACDSYLHQYPSNLQLTNCILWDGGNEIWNNDGSTITITYSDVQGGWLSEGNIDDDPLFVELGYWDANGTPYDANDDFWIDGDNHLKSEAGRWDANSESWVQDANTSPCIDAGNPMSPIGNEPFPNGGRVNMGAYGATSEASKSYFGTTPCEIIVAGDVNGDCEVNFLDFRLMALHWCEDNNP